MKIYTKTGDSGETSLYGNVRVSKADARVDAYGEVDELNAAIGATLSTRPDADLAELLQTIQRELFALGSRLADPSAKVAARVEKAFVSAANVERLEKAIDRFEEELPPLRAFILPGGSPAGALLHLSRTICRRAERRVIGLGADAVDPIVIVYLNRLSDLLFVMARVANHRAGVAQRSNGNGMNSVVVHYQEIALKGKNRPWFLGRLVRNLREAVSDLDVEAVRPLMGRIEIVLGPGATREAVAERVSRTFGIANFSFAGRTRLDLDALTDAILQDLQGRTCRSFRVSARRADKRFPLTSPQVEREVGGRIQEARGWKVDLEEADLVIHVELLTSEAFYAFGKERGPGGLPIGTAGRVACLLSGGIDSPVAAHRMMKRGCRVTFIHFHSYPILSRASQEKARELVTLLTRWQHRSRLYLVAFGEIQQQVVLGVPGPMRVIVYRRLMLRIAERIARTRGALGLVTGDVVGQVASQTLENLAVVGNVATLPLYRPLIGMDKEEITAEAIKIGTYPISIIPDQDCCTLFTPRNPQTRAKLDHIEAAEKVLPIEELVERAVAEAVVEDFQSPMIGSRSEVQSGVSNRD